MTNEALQYDVTVNLDDFTKSIKKLLVETKKTGQNAAKGFAEIDKAVLKLDASMQKTGNKFGKKFTLGTSEINNEMKKVLVNAIKTGDNVVKSFRKADKVIDKFGSSLKGVTNKQKKVSAGFTTMTSKTSKLESTVKKLAGAYIGLAGARKLFRESIEIAQKVITETGQLQTAGEKWKILTGDIQEADKVLKDLFYFSHRTPFTFKDVNTAATQLHILTDGALQGVDAIEQMADRAALAKVPMSQLTTWWGRLYSGMQSGRSIGRALTRMQQLGIVSGKLRNKIDNLSKSEMMDGTGWKMFIEGTSKAEGSIENLSKTIEGKISTLSGVWDAMFAFDDKASQDNISGVVQELIDSLMRATPQVQAILKDMFSIIGDQMIGMLQTVTSIYDFIKPEEGKFNQYKKDLLLIQTQALKQSPEKRTEVLNRNQTSLTQTTRDLYNTPAFEYNLGGGASPTLSRYKTGKHTNKARIPIIEDLKKAIEESDIKQLYKLMDEQNLSDKMNSLINRFIENTKFVKANSIALNSNTKTDAPKLPGLAGFGGGGGGSKIKPNNLFSMDDIWRGISVFDAPSIDQIGKNLQDTEIYEIGSKREDYTNFIGGMGKNIDKIDEDNKKNDSDARNKELQAQQDFYSKTISIIGDSEQAILNIHKTWSADSLSTFTSGLAGLTGNASGILGTLGMVDPSGVLGIASAGLSLVSGIAGLFEDDENESSSSSASASTVNRANIVSSGPENFYQTNQVSIYTSYIGDDTGTKEFFYDKIIPLIEESTASVV